MKRRDGILTSLFCLTGVCLMAAVIGLLSGSLSRNPLHAQPSSSPPMKPSVAPAETPPADAAAQTGQRWLALSLQDAVRLALQQNLDIKRERLSPQIASTIVDQERSIFDPLISLAANLSQLQALPENQLVTTDPDTGEPVTSTIAGVVSKDAEVTPTLHQTIPIGGFYELSFINTASDLDPASSGAVTRIANPRHESHLTLSFTQPLLRDFGIQVNTTFIRQAQKTTAIAEQQALQAVLDIIFVVQQRYWELVFRLRELDARLASLKLAEQFLAENKVKVELDVLLPVELLQAETQVKFRQGEIVTAKAAVQTAADLLKAVLNLPESEQTWHIDMRPTDGLNVSPIPTLSEDEQLALALNNRPDLAQSQLDIESRLIQRNFARNQLLPRLDLISSGSLSAFGGDSLEGVENLQDTDGYQWFVGMQIEYPLGNRFARRRLQQRNLEIEQGLFDQRILKIVIGTEVRQAVRDIRAIGERVTITQATTQLAERQLEGEQEKFEIGLSNSFQVLQLQGQLTAARIDGLRTAADYNTALARLDQITGTVRYGDVSTRFKPTQR